uniref:Uncharacterized protein n=1 Tax=Oryza meridionalis TaxID=40149 RepID=A0A0E0DBA2_9ORYZ
LHFPSTPLPRPSPLHLSSPLPSPHLSSSPRPPAAASPGGGQRVAPGPSLPDLARGGLGEGGGARWGGRQHGAAGRSAVLCGGRKAVGRTAAPLRPSLPDLAGGGRGEEAGGQRLGVDGGWTAAAPLPPSLPDLAGERRGETGGRPAARGQKAAATTGGDGKLPPYLPLTPALRGFRERLAAARRQVLHPGWGSGDGVAPLDDFYLNFVHDCVDE